MSKSDRKLVFIPVSSVSVTDDLNISKFLCLKQSSPDCKWVRKLLGY